MQSSASHLCVILCLYSSIGTLALDSHQQGHNEALRDTVSEFTNALLDAKPAIPGLDATIVVPARRLHFTLGVMSLDLDEPSAAGKAPRTLDAAKKLLREVKPKITELLGGNTFRVPLNSLDIMKPEAGDRARAHVMWVGPTEGEGLKNAIIFCNRKTEVDIVAKSLKAHGFDAAPIHGDEPGPADGAPAR